MIKCEKIFLEMITSCSHVNRNVHTPKLAFSDNLKLPSYFPFLNVTFWNDIIAFRLGSVIEITFAHVGVAIFVSESNAKILN